MFVEVKQASEMVCWSDQETDDRDEVGYGLRQIVWMDRLMIGETLLFAKKTVLRWRNYISMHKQPNIYSMEWGFFIHSHSRPGIVKLRFHPLGHLKGSCVPCFHCCFSSAVGSGEEEELAKKKAAEEAASGFQPMWDTRSCGPGHGLPIRDVEFQLPGGFRRG